MTLHPAVSQSMLAARPSRVGLFIGLSVAGHVLLLAIAMVYTQLTSRPKVDPNPPVIRATLVRQGKPRDPKLLPRKEQLPPPPKEVKAPPAPPPQTPPPVEKVSVPVPGLQPAPPPAPQKGEASSEDRRKRLFGAFDKTSQKPTEPEELEGAEDGDPDGDSAIAEGERYYALLSTQVRRNYNVADTIPETERLHLKAQVQMRLGRTGEVLETRLVATSGNDLFDSSVLAAVKKASPFSPPPDHLRDALQKQGVVLEFRP
ncbi:energy transducer TonB [Stigmatella sp. ncwal1]|uniref:Energy transducer TonB n=1 Tax=Stigmatella ashevillensis TaxID=2995309 RepID=A0ABT5D7W2_9BACT|nr:energy transducer TonB [Stigmatella ashevillena]MDC0709755.1 energy transducer TonB [Stigmatella ashevillena]